jgi:murein DD-endopeptidase MepM/ murein hydrolase activator NlpD
MFVSLLGAVALGVMVAAAVPEAPARSDPLLPIPSPTLPSLEPSPDPTDVLPDPGDLLPGGGGEPSAPGGDTGPLDPGGDSDPKAPDDGEGSRSGGDPPARPRPADPDDPGGDRYPHPPFAPIAGNPDAALLQRLYNAQAEQRALQNRIWTVQARLSGAEAALRRAEAEQADARQARDLALTGMRDTVLSIYKSGAPYGLYLALEPGTVRGDAQGRLAVAAAASERLGPLDELVSERTARRDKLARELASLRQRLDPATDRVNDHLLAANRLPQAGPGDGSLRWPLGGPVTSGYGNRYDPYYRSWQLHAGIDIAAPAGALIRAAAAGRVVQAGRFGGYGNYLCLAHGTVRGQRLTTCYGHQSRILVTKGQRVRAGQTVGQVGSTGASTGPHLHFEVRLGGRPTDPRLWL